MRCTERIDRPWHHSGSVDHAGFHSGERVLRPQSGIDVCDLDPRGRHLHGGVARVQGRHDPGKQHRSDSRVGCRNAFRDHLRLARPGDYRLVDRIPVLDVGVDLRAGRRPGRDVFDPAATRPRDRIGLAVPGRRGVRRSAEGRGWRHHRGGRRRRNARRPACGGWRFDRVRRVRDHRSHPNIRQRPRPVFPRWRAG